MYVGGVCAKRPRTSKRLSFILVFLCAEMLWTGSETTLSCTGTKVVGFLHNRLLRSGVSAWEKAFNC